MRSGTTASRTHVWPDALAHGRPVPGTHGGFGLNLVSGNYEFACLLVIENDEFWTRYGGEIEANWEASGLRLYSSLDHQLVDELITDESWSNEGIFAFLQGIRRLRESSDERAKLPFIQIDPGD